MKISQKYLLNGVAALAIALGALGGGVAEAKNKSDTIKPNPPTAAPIETGQLLIKDKPIANQGAAATENDLCGVPYTPPCSSAARQKSDTIKPNPPTATDYETGQLLIKDRPK